MNCSKHLIFYTTFAILISLSQCQQVAKDKEFDFLLFAQIWPISDCIDWQDRNDNNSCSLPNREDWSVHGIWPTKNKEIGPLNCNRSIHFDFEQIKPILDQLRLRWTNVHANSKEDSFWLHEWTKHGSCAVQLEPLDSELKYFSKGLEWNDKYPISSYLSNYSIRPGGVYTSQDIVKAIKASIGDFNPALECEHLEGFVNPVLTQISLCFDKQLNLIGCDEAHGGVFGRCPQFGEVEYPKTEKKGQKGRKGIIWGLVIGGGIMLGVIIYVIKGQCKQRSRNRGYEEL